MTGALNTYKSSGYKIRNRNHAKYDIIQFHKFPFDPTDLNLLDTSSILPDALRLSGPGNSGNKSLGSAGHQLAEAQFTQTIGFFDHFYLGIDLVADAFHMGYHADQFAMGLQTLQR